MSRFDIGILILTIVALILSFPPFWGGPIAMIALIPLFFFIRNQSTKKGIIRPFFVGLCGYLIGILWTLGTLYWIGWATIAGLIGTLIYVPIYIGIFAFLLDIMIKVWGLKSIWAAPVLWTGMEIIQSAGPLGFPWNQMANTQTYILPWIQFTSILGSYAVSFWVVLINVVIFSLMLGFGKNKRTFFLLLLLVLVIAIPTIHGQVILKAKKNNKISLHVTLVQGNIDPYKKWTPTFIDSNFTVYERLTLSSDSSCPDLIVWPETATPCYLRYRFQYLSQVQTIAEHINTPILTGSPDYEWNDGHADVYNAALLIQPNSSHIQQYYKLKLVPFSERVPLIDYFPFIYNWLSDLNLDVGNYVPGDSITLFRVITKKNIPLLFGTAICYDSVFPFHVREYVIKGANFLTIITNDGWFGRTSGPYQHAQIAVLRAIENRRWIIRCANTGISGFIDPYGHFYQKSTIYKEAVLQHLIEPRYDKTFFVRYGHWFHRIMLIINIIMIVLLLVDSIKYIAKESNVDRILTS